MSGAYQRADTRAPPTWPLGIAAFESFVCRNLSQPSVSRDKGLTKESDGSATPNGQVVDARVSALSA